MIELNHGVDVHFEYQLKILIYRRITRHVAVIFLVHVARFLFSITSKS
jgi:hypothetical protein